MTPPALPGEDLAAAWRAARDRPEVTHLDAAAAGRMSRSVLSAVAAHLRAESSRGAYVAALAVEPLLAGLRADLAGLLDPTGLTAADVALVGSASDAFAALVGAWPLPAGSRVGILRSEYGGNTMTLAARAERAGWTLVDLPVGADGPVDLAAFDPAGLALVTFPQVASQSGIVQPAAEVAATCAAAGVPLLLDVAQAVGQVTVAPGAAAYVGTSRKWLCGPRGVGFLAVGRQVADTLDPPYPNLDTHAWSADGRRPGAPAAGVERFTVGEANVAGRVGLAVAVRELVDTGPARGFARIAALGAYARTRLDGVAGWTVRESGAAGGTVTLAPPPGADPAGVRARLLAGHAVLTSAVPVGRAPRDLPGPVLRASCHAYATAAEIDRLADALGKVTAAVGARR